ncbi:MAG: SDR family NAD(P)-dependent oxidoreductase, partial [Clostridia bacterium]|nr:SDR family NAD(P)-dependent oxidoreductase [Clostridia bacterium]
MFTGRCALITGATRGIGKAIALRLAKDGASLILLGTSPADRAADTLREVTATGVRAAYYQCNVANAAEVDATVKAAIADFGRIDILINNAG